MKKILIATTALIATTTVAMAEAPSISGYGRFGLSYDGSAGAGVAKTQIDTRLRFNIDVTKETDSGVTFGGRVRLQYDDNTVGASRLNAANVYASYNGLKVTVGNVGGAYDNAALAYNSEVGYIGQSHGNPGGSFFGYTTGAYAANRMGINAAYSVAGFNIEASYINPDQTMSSLPAGTAAEFALTANYKVEQFTVSAAIAKNGAGIDNNDLTFVGAQYALSSASNIGLLYFDNGNKTVDGRTITLYGNHKMDAITLRGYVANNNKAGNKAAGMTETAFGVGVDYDLGGAMLAGSVERGYNKKTRGALGVKFSF